MTSQSSPDKRADLLAAALKLFVDQGFHGTPTSKIAAVAGVSNGTLFHYFPTKEVLITELFVSIKAEMHAFIEARISPEASVQAQIQFLLELTLRWALDHPSEFWYVQQVHLSPYIRHIPPDQMQYHKSLLDQARRENALKPLPDDLIISLLSSHLFGMYQYLIQTPPEQHDALIAAAVDLIWTLIAA